jgi:hypothetical protein
MWFFKKKFSKKKNSALGKVTAQNKGSITTPSGQSLHWEIIKGDKPIPPAK